MVATIEQTCWEIVEKLTNKSQGKKDFYKAFSCLAEFGL